MNTQLSTAIINAFFVSASEFVAKKHGVTLEVIADALEAGNERIASQISELMLSATAALLN